MTRTPWLLLLLLPLSTASAQTSTTRTYALEKTSAYETGCFGPCLCAVISQRLQGTFDLTYAGYDGLYDNYVVKNVQWSLPDGTADLPIRGSGTYRVGGEFAITQEMNLDLTIGDKAPRRFASGVVSGGGSFPSIQIQMSLHAMACTDTVIDLSASPLQVSGVPPVENTPAVRWERAAPNPFGEKTELHLAASRPVTARIRILDASGRVVRVLVDAAALSAGIHPLTWDGRDGRGREVGAGIYFATAQVGGRTFAQRIVRLK